VQLSQVIAPNPAVKAAYDEAYERHSKLGARLFAPAGSAAP
jgi:hypothetical protein